MKTRKVFAVFCAILIVLSTSAFFVLAKTNTTKISVESINALAGDTVEVNISIENNPGILGATVIVNYDGRLKLINSKNGFAFSALDMTKPGRYETPCNFAWDAVEISSDNIKDGTVLTLTFEIPSTASNGDTYSIQLSSEYGDIIDTDLNPVNVEFEAGTITVGSTQQPEDPVQSDKTTFSVESVQGVAGSTIDVDVNISNNPGILGAVISLDYDSRLVLKNAVNGEAFSALTMTKPGRYTSPCNFTWDAVDISQSDIKDGTVLTLTFEIPSYAKDGDIYTIYASSSAGDIIDYELNEVSPEFVSGKIAIGTPVEPETNETRFVVESVEGVAGSDVGVNISVENNPGILGATLSLSYDDGLVLKNATAGSAFSVLTLTRPGRYQSPCQFAWDGMDISAQDITDGIVLTLTFELPSNAENGHKYNIEVSSEYGDIVDYELNAVAADFVSGGITVQHTHSYTARTVQPTCTERGYVKYTCAYCSDEYITNYVDSLGHYYQYTGNGVNRIMTYRCGDCGYTMSLNAEDVLNLWDESYINIKPNSIDNRSKKDNSSILNVVGNANGDEIINAKDYALILKSSKK